MTSPVLDAATHRTWRRPIPAALLLLLLAGAAFFWWNRRPLTQTERLFLGTWLVDGGGPELHFSSDRRMWTGVQPTSRTYSWRCEGDELITERKRTLRPPGGWGYLQWLRSLLTPPPSPVEPQQAGFEFLDDDTMIVAGIQFRRKVAMN
jgi:hypothetical protein